MRVVYQPESTNETLQRLEAIIHENSFGSFITRFASRIQYIELTPDEFKSIESYLDPVYIGGEQIKADNPTYKGYNIRVVKA